MPTTLIQLIFNCCLALSIKDGDTMNLKVTLWIAIVLSLFVKDLPYYLKVINVLIPCINKCICFLFCFSLRGTSQWFHPERITDPHFWPFLWLGSGNQENECFRVESVLHQPELYRLIKVFISCIQSYLLQTSFKIIFLMTCDIMCLFHTILRYLTRKTKTNMSVWFWQNSLFISVQQHYRQRWFQSIDSIWS